MEYQNSGPSGTLKRLFYKLCLEMTRQSKENIATLPRISPLPVN